MNKRVFVAHGWGGSPDGIWLPWLATELEKNGFEVHIPQLPDPEVPRINTWVHKLAQTVQEVNDNTYFVGHSLGCMTIARFLESLPDKQKVGGAVFVAGFFKRLTNLEDEPGVPETAKHWLDTPLDLKKVKSHLPKSIAIFSDNDPFVPLDNQDDFESILGSKIIILHKKEHFGVASGITQFPTVLSSILKLSKT
jgi:uncharacterized protein